MVAFPYQKTGDPHQHIERGPYRTKKPAGRIPGWLVEREVPGLDGAQRKKCPQTSGDLREEQADKEFECLGHDLDRFQQGTKSDGLILIPLLSFGAQGWGMHSFVLEHAIHGLRKVLNAIVDRAILGMMDQAVEDMMMEDPCSQDLGNVGGFHPGDKVLLNCWA